MSSSLFRGWRLWVTTAVATGITMLPPTIQAVHAADSRPNILVIVTDDQRFEGTMDVLPKTVAWFGQGGTEFPNGFVTTPLCCPARTSNFTGRYAHNHGVVTNAGASLFDPTTSVQRYLHDAGYFTALAGKYLNDYQGPRVPAFFDNAALNEAYVNKAGGYNTNVIASHATDYLTAFESDDDRPWMMFLTPKAPHSPFKAEAQYASAPVPARTPNPALSSGISGKLPALSLFQAEPGEGESTRVAQLRTLMSVDDMVDRIMQQLTTFGEDQRTLAFFLSDNGYVWGEFGLKSMKLLPYPPSVRVPFFMRWPGHVAAGATDERLAANIDLAPTILDAAGTPAPTSPPMDGVSLLQPDTRNRLTLEYFLTVDAPRLPRWSSTVTRDWQYIEWYADNSQDILFREYYDLTTDPWETTNVLQDGNPGDDPDVDLLSRNLAVDRVCSGVPCTDAPQPDVAPPDRPTGLSAVVGGGVQLTWVAPHDDVGVTGYVVRRDGNTIAQTGATTSYADADAPTSGTLSYDVIAIDRAGNQSLPSTPAVVSRNETVLFADGFESGTAAAWSSTVRMTVQQQDVAVGAWGARLLAPAAAAFARAQLATTVPGVRLRMQFLLRSKAAGSAVILARVLPTSGLTARVFIAKDGKLGFVNETTNASIKSPVIVSMGVWHQLDLVVRVGTSGHVTVRLDGLSPSSLDRAVSFGGANLASIQVGDHLGHRTYDLIVDDVQATSLP